MSPFIHETKNMKCSIFIPLILLSLLFIPYSSLTITTTTKVQLVTEESKDYQHMSRVEKDHVQRKALHEVHSGPNPISNSIPQQKLKPDKERNP
ncbi:hypothetical protein Lal_00035112 [Lupinus albus]|nr:hypothetical protein Lal_00035112 [Lupinus albus]